VRILATVTPPAPAGRTRRSVATSTTSARAQRRLTQITA